MTSVKDMEDKIKLLRLRYQQEQEQFPTFLANQIFAFQGKLQEISGAIKVLEEEIVAEKQRIEDIKKKKAEEKLQEKEVKK